MAQDSEKMAQKAQKRLKILPLQSKNYSNNNE